MRQYSFLLVGMIFLIGCGKGKSDVPESPRIKNKKTTKIVSPKINQEVKIGEDVFFELQSDVVKIDSIRIQAGGFEETFNNSTFTWNPPGIATGTYKIQLTAYYNDSEEVHYSKLKLFSNIQPEQFSYVITGTYPHNTDDYTQGLFFLNNELIESTGQKRKSAIKKVNPITGEAISNIPLEDQYFGEGCTLFNNEIYQLTWTSRVGFVYDLDLNLKKSFQYDTQGWGLTTMGDSLVMSDGSEKIYFMNPGDFSEIGRIEVYNDQGAVDSLNELEYINGLIYANEYQTNFIHAIEPSTGRILKTIDLSGLLTDAESQKADVLNGIAYDQKGDRLFVTGKWWPWLFEIKLQPKKSKI